MDFMWGQGGQGGDARFLKVCRYNQLRRNSCYDELGRNSNSFVVAAFTTNLVVIVIGHIVSTMLVVMLPPSLSYDLLCELNRTTNNLVETVITTKLAVIAYFE